MALKLLTICHMHPSRRLPRHGVFLQRQAGFLKALDVDCTFLVPRPWMPWPLSQLMRTPDGYGNANPLIRNGNPVRETRFLRLPGRWFNRLEEKYLAQSLLAPARELHAQEKFDAIWACPVIPDAVAVLPIKKALQLPLATLAIGSDIMVHSENPVLQKQIRNVLSQSDLCVGVSNAICQRMRELERCDPICVFLGRDTSMFRPPKDRSRIRDELGLPGDAIIAAYVGLVAPAKGIAELSEAARSALADPNFHLLCVGRGPSVKLLEEIGSDRIHLCGEQSPEMVPTYLQAADFFVFPSYTEGMPQAVLEAMHCGLPIVATDVGGTSEAVLDGENGILVPPRRSDLLSEAMNKMIHDQDFRERAGRRSQEVAEAQFDSEANAMKLADALKGMVAEAKAG